MYIMLQKQKLFKPCMHLVCMERVCKLTLLFICILCIQLSFVYAEQESLGVFKLEECVELKQTCASCSYVNVTEVLYPNSSQALGQVLMAGDNSVYTFQFCNATELGNYIVTGIGDVDGTDTVFAYDFSVTPNGEAPTTSKGIIQLDLLALLLILLVLCIMGIFKFENYMGKFSFYWGGHILSIAVVFISWQMANDYLTGTPFISSMFKIIFWVLLVGTFPMLILSLSWIFYIHTMNDTIRGLIERGMPEAEAYERATKKKGGRNW